MAVRREDLPVTGLPPVEGRRARVLVLGSLPGRLSLAADEYYAHPRNVLWTAMERLGVPRALPYAERCRRLCAAGVALWDVAARARRPGSSLDAAIRAAEPNDLAGFHARHPELAAVLFNGRAAFELFERGPGRAGTFAGLELVPLPSTSPANTAGDKLARWVEVLERLLPAEARA